jgi:AcrR family transcriptional regulator
VSYETLQSAQDVLVAMVGDVDPASPRGKTRRRLIDAAAELFVAQGYRKTSIDEIARRAGIGKGTVYLHFTAKVDLLTAAVAREKLRSLALAADVYAAGASARDRLRGWVRAALLMVATSPLIARLVDGDEELSAALADLDPALRSQRLAHRDELLGKLLDEAAGPPGLTAEQRRERIVVLESLTRLAPRLRSPELHQGLGVERFADVLAGIIADGLAAQVVPVVPGTP